MKIVCVVATSINGKITKGDKSIVSEWTSKEDQEHFAKIIDNATLIIMGRKTYETAKPFMTHKKGRLRLILTSNSGKYQKETIPNILEFTDNSPDKLLERVEKINFKTAILLGGSEIYTMFLKHNFIDELWLTLEPKIFGQGTPLFAEENFEKELKLLSVEKLNSQGTLLLKYKVK